MEIKIICFLENNISRNHYKICVYDTENKLIYSGKTNENGISEVCLPCIKICKIIAISNYERICVPAIINSNNIIPIKFHNPMNSVKFTLTDKNYEGLSTMKGVINLWQ